MKNTSVQNVLPTVLSKADQLYQSGRIAAAANLLSKGIECLPEAGELCCALAEMLIEDEQYQNALDIVDDIPPAEFESRKAELKCCCLEGLERFQEAEEIIDSVISAETPSAAALNLKGELLFHRQNFQDARMFFQRSIQTDARYGQAYINLGLLKLGLDEGSDALDILETGFVLAPHIKHVADTYHELIGEIGAYERAEPLFKNACRQHPGNKRLAYLFIDILLNRNRTKAALARIQTAIATFGIEDGILEPALKIANSSESWSENVSGGNISLCMIVKDEENNLAQCLESLKTVAGEMVVVDTGSRDRTIDIARIFGARIYLFEWNDDFSSARNFSLSKAGYDWIIVLDADEIIASSDLELLRRITQDSEKRTAYSFVTRNYTNDSGTEGWQANDDQYHSEQAGDGWNPSEKVRLFPNDKRIQFKNAVHELIEPSLRRAGIPIQKCSIPIHHYGVLNQDKTARKKSNYYSLGKVKMARKNGDLPVLMECAIQAAEVGEYAEAVNLWQDVLRLKPDLAKAYFNLSFAFIQLEKYHDGLAAARRAMALDPALKEAALNYALCLLRSGDIQTATGQLENFLTRNPVHPMATGLLAVSHCIGGNANKGLQLFDRLKNLGFNCPEYIHDHALKLIAAGKSHEAAILLDSLVETPLYTQEIRLLQCELSDFEVKERPLKIRIYEAENFPPGLLRYLHPLPDYQLRNRTLFSKAENDESAEFIIIPFSIDSLYHHLGYRGFLECLGQLPGFNANEHKFVFFFVDDIGSRMNIESVIYRVNHDKQKVDTNSITLPYFTDDLHRYPGGEGLPHQVSFVGTIATHPHRAAMLIPFIAKADLPLYNSFLGIQQSLIANRKDSEAYRSDMDETLSLADTLFPINASLHGLKYFIDITVEQFHKLPQPVQKARKESFVDVLSKSRSVLCPRGVGVQSIRFFETLSAGRVPVLISDDYMLPLDDHIDYSAIVWNIAESRILDLPDEIEKLFRSESDDEIGQRAEKARRTWQMYFRPSKRGDFVNLTLKEVLKRDYRLNAV